MKKLTNTKAIVIALALVAGVGSCRSNTANTGEAQVEDPIMVSPDAAPQWRAVEVIGRDTAFGKVMSFLAKRGILRTDLYTWKNHLVVYGDLPGAEQLATALRDSFTADSVKYYPEAFYTFSRKHCDSNSTVAVSDWDNILLTANLVADTILQKEYMQYHATQFQKWPEVAKGFCNANFQQLLVFRNGRQLMLVISIPKGGSLDELNPKTEENNPRVKEWNKMMAKYQEGIPGTRPGETWVFLSPVR